MGQQLSQGVRLCTMDSGEEPATSTTAGDTHTTGGGACEEGAAIGKGQSRGHLVHVFGSSRRSKENQGLSAEGGPESSETCLKQSIVRSSTRSVFGRRSRKSCKEQSSAIQERSHSTSGKKKRTQHHWVSKFNCRRMKVASSKAPETCDIPQPSVTCEACICTGYRRTAEHHLGAGVVFQAAPYRRILPEVDSLPPPDPDEEAAEMEARAARATRRSSCPSTLGSQVSLAVGPVVNTPIEGNNSQEAEAAASVLLADPVIDLSRFKPEDYPIEDCDELARLERAREIREGVDPPPGFMPNQVTTLRRLRQLNQIAPDLLALNGLAEALFHTHIVSPLLGGSPGDPTSSLNAALTAALVPIPSPAPPPPEPPERVHTQVDYIHCLVPDLNKITACSFYWGKMDRYEAERLLEGRPEGSFLLRDSAQDEYLFSVSFRKYGRSLHARIEQWNHRFSFDSHDPGVFASGTVCGLIEHYKDPACCMFFEPMLTLPLPRTSPFSLQHLCRAVACSHINYDGVTQLHIPRALKTYLKEYHYKQRVRVRRYDTEN